MIDKRKDPKSVLAYGVYNFGNFWETYRTRSSAIRAIEKATGKPWSEARKFMEVHKVRVETYRP